MRTASVTDYQKKYPKMPKKNTKLSCSGSCMKQNDLNLI